MLSISTSSGSGNSSAPRPPSNGPAQPSDPPRGAAAGEHRLGRERRVRATRETSYAVRWCPEPQAVRSALIDRLAGDRSLFVTTPSVDRAWGARFLRPIAREVGASVLVLPCSEGSKTMQNALVICERAREIGLPRTGMLVAVSGGVASDLVTMAASLLRRGVGHVRVPTTLLGIVDAALGVKGAVNFDGAKNSLGCFHSPSEVLLCPRFLETLPVREIRSGLGEVLKAAMAVDAGLFERLERLGASWAKRGFDACQPGVPELLWRSAECMLDELEPNLFEDRTFVRKMDFAHTFGPALEASADFALTHGESVAIDALFSSFLAAELGWLDSSELNRILGLYEALGLLKVHPALEVELCQRALDEAMRHRGGRLLLFLPTRVGEVRLWTDRGALDERVLSAAIHAWRACA